MVRLLSRALRLLSPCLLVLAPAALLAQATAPAVTFANTNVGATTTGTVTFTFSAATTVSSVSVVTQGVPSLDFQAGAAGSGACTATNYMSGQTCTVAVKFTPTAPGLRLGAALLLDSSKNKLGVGLVSGTGNGALLTVGNFAQTTTINFQPYGCYALVVDPAGNVFFGGSNEGYPVGEYNNQGTFVGGFNAPGYSTGTYVHGVALNGAGYLYASDPSNGNIYKIDPVTGAASVLANTTQPEGLAVGPDGSLYVATYGGGVQKISTTGTVSTLTDAGGNVNAVAVDASGAVYYGNSTSLVKFAAGTNTVLGTVDYQVNYLAIDAAANLYAETQDHVYELPAGSSTANILSALPALLQNPLTVDAKGNLYQYHSNGNGNTIGVYNRTAVALAAASGTTTSVNATSPPQAVTVENDGSTAAAITSITGSAAANATGYTCTTATSLVPGGTCTLGVEFAPTTHGSPQTGTITLGGSLFTPPSISITGYVTGDPTQLAFASAPPASLQNGQNAGTVTVAIKDNGAGPTTSTASVTLAVSGSNGYSNSYTVAAVNGTATFNTSGAALATGTYTYTASSTGLTSASASEIVYPYKLIFTTPPATPLSAGGNAGMVMVAIQDNSGNATTQTSTVTLSVTGPSGYTATYNQPAVNGTATFNLSGVALTVSGTYNYIASSSGLTSAPQASETVNTGPPAHLGIAANSSSVYVGQLVAITVAAQDTYNNTVTSDTDTVALTSTDSTATLPANFALVNGTATTSVKFGQTGSFTLTASDVTNTALASGTTPSITVSLVPSYTVTTSGDDAASPSAANCSNQSNAGATLDSSCSLRDAIAATNALNLTGTTNVQPTINFAPALSGGTVTLTAALKPTANVNITGPGAALLTIAPATTSAYSAIAASTGSIALSLSGVTMIHFGTTSFSDVAAIQVTGNSASTPSLLTLGNDTFKSNNADGVVTTTYTTLVINTSSFLGNQNTTVVSATSAPSVTIMGSTFGSQAAPNLASGSNGGALYLAASPATISTSTFAYNQASSGGAIYAFAGGALTLNNDVFLNNSATNGIGGAVESSTSAMTVMGCTFNNNTSTGNGGAINSSVSLTISGSSFSGNQAGSNSNAYGGAIYNAVSIAGSITNSNFIGNRAVTTGGLANGGALYSDHLSLTNVLFYGNYVSGSSADEGAAAYYTGLYTSNLTGVTFTGNYTTGSTGSQVGGALYQFQSTLNLYNTTITGNSAGTGGGVYKFSGSLNLYNSVISGNTATSAFPDVSSGATSSTSSYLGAGNGTTCTAYCTPLLSALGSFGGGTVGAPGYTTPVMTMIPLPGSPLLAAGQTGSVNGATTDARGYARTVNGYVDIGAAEAKYSLAFVKQPVNAEVGASDISTVQLYESGNLFAPGVTGGTLGLTSAAAQSSATAAMSAAGLEAINAKYSAVTTGDTLTAAVQTSGGTTLASVTSNPFNVVSATGTTVAGLVVEGFPASTAGGLAQTFRVTAVDAGGAVFAGYTGTVTFSSSDPSATLPGPYTFTSADAGVHTFPATLATPGMQSITATDGTFTASQTGIIVSDYVLVLNANGTTAKLSGSGSQLLTAGSATTPGTLGGLAVNNTGTVYSVINSANSVGVSSAAGVAGAALTGGGLNAPVSVAIDGLGAIWVANSGNNTLSQFLASGTAQSPTAGYGTSDPLSAPSAIVLDNTGGVWVASKTGNSVTHVFGAAAPVTTPATAALGNSTVGVRP